MQRISVIGTTGSGKTTVARRTDSEALARDLGIAVSTLSEILRAAERRIFSEYMRT
jgi:predicted DNA binding protein